jgi:hypothetical protein
MIGTMSKDSAWYVNVQVCESVIKFKVDTGAETNTVPMNVWKRIPSKPTLMWSNVVLSVFGGGTVQHDGVARVPLQAGDQKIISELFVTSGRSTPILGLKACLKLGIVQAGDNHNPSLIESFPLSSNNPITMKILMKEYDAAFTGLEC